MARQTLDYEERFSNIRVTIGNSLQPHRDDLNELLKANETFFMISNSKLKIYCNQLFDKDWKTGLNNPSKCNAYIMFKSLPKHESYLSQVKNRKHRISLTKLRVSDHKLMIEEGRNKRPIIPREELKCPTCLHTFENEEHFITTCLLYKTRIELFQRISIILPGFRNMKDKTAQFIFLFSQENSEINTLLAKHVLERFEI